MFGHPLNPHASSFIPSKNSEAIREMAARSVAKLWEKKKASREQSITNQEIAELVGHLISIGYKELTNSDQTKLQNYLNSKLLSKVPASRLIAKYPKIKSKPSMKSPKGEVVFDLSKFQIPQLPFLLVAFWGLYRHEQAQRPLLSLTFRPDVVKDKIWSVTANDEKLWNKSCVSELCECPAMFGYSVPSNFFGDLPHLNHRCPVQKIHLNHYPESKDGNEFILMHNRQHGLEDEQPFQDFEIKVNIEVDAKTLRGQFETTVSGIYDLLSKFADDGCETENREVEDESHYYTSFWDDVDTKLSHVPIFQQNRDSLVDDNDHPLLEVSHVNSNEEIPIEVKEMLRKSLSSRKNKHTSEDISDLEEKDGICDPPCSIWCDSARKNSLDKTNMDFDLSQDLQNFQNTPLIDLITFEQPDSKQMAVDIILKPAASFCGSKRNPSKHSLSLNDYDPSLYDADFKGVTAHAYELTPPMDMFAFPKKNPVNFFKNRRDSWQDTDSGFMSLSSSEEDIFGDICKKDSTWKFVSGEDSLWQPLPECVETIETKMSFPRKQAQNFRHRRSVS